MHGPNKKRKPSTEINIYREACRDLVAKHPKLSPLRRLILVRLTHYINRHTWDAFVSEETMAKDCRTTTRTIRRAFEDGKALGIIERTRRGNQYIGASHHVFKLKHPEVHRTPEAVHRTLEASAPDSSVPLTSDEHLNNLTSKKDMDMEVKEVVGEQGEPEKPLAWTTPSLTEIEYTPELKRLYLLAKHSKAAEVYSPGVVPQRYWR
jgi:hypothetical protein